MNRKSKIILIILIITIILIFFLQKAYENVRIGNNNIKSEMDLIEYILNISSYDAELEVTISSNKTTNKYLLKQYYMEPNFFKQIVIEPTNIKNLETIYNGKSLEIRNTNLSLSKIYEDYAYLNNNMLWLRYVNEICSTQGYIVKKNDNEIILEFNIKDSNFKGMLYLNKDINLPTKIEILDNSNKSKIYIEYKEIKLNNIHENNIFN